MTGRAHHLYAHNRDGSAPEALLPVVLSVS